MFLLWSVEFHSYFTVIMRCCCSIDKVDNSRGYQGRSVCCAGIGKNAARGMEILLDWQHV